MKLREIYGLASSRKTRFSVIPAKAGIRLSILFWTPAFAGVTTEMASREANKFL